MSTNTNTGWPEEVVRKAWSEVLDECPPEDYLPELRGMERVREIGAILFASHSDVLVEALHEVDKLAEWFFTRTEQTDATIDEFARRWGRLSYRVVLDGPCGGCGQLPEIVGFDEDHRTHLLRCGCTSRTALDQYQAGGES